MRETGTNCKLKTKSFTFDGATEKKKSERRTTAGCNPTDKNSMSEKSKSISRTFILQNANLVPVCKTDKKFKDKGWTDCDEFPLASTKEADARGQVFRCVPASDNRSKLNYINKEENINIPFPSAIKELNADTTVTFNRSRRTDHERH